MNGAPEQWMTFRNPKFNWQFGNDVTVHGEDDIITRAEPRLFWMKDMSFFRAYKEALEQGLELLSYSAYNIKKKYNIKFTKEPVNASKKF